MEQGIAIVLVAAIGIERKMRKRWLVTAGILAIIVTGATGCSAWNDSWSRQSAWSAEPPAEPDYAQGSTWLAFPGRKGLERSVPPGFKAVDEATASADVFFVHPTTYLKDDVMNAPYESVSELSAQVLLGQISAFNGCCALYAPRYRQASLRGIPNDGAITLAYSDVARAFRYYLEHHNRGRPFILASHSQGTEHAVRLLQEEIVGTPLKQRLIVAYTVGAYTPTTFATMGLPLCGNAKETGCVVSWNTVQEGRKGASLLVKKVKFWWQGERILSTAPAVCVNPLTWDETGVADAVSNLGALEFPGSASSGHRGQLKPLVRGLTGARCLGTLLEVKINSDSSFHDKLSRRFGSYHLNDYGIFYANIRANAIERVSSWRARNPSRAI